MSFTELYDQDFSIWAEKMSQLILQRDFEALDLENLSEEVLDLSRSQKRELKSRLLILLMHLLKWQYQPEVARTPAPISFNASQVTSSSS